MPDHEQMRKRFACGAELVLTIDRAAIEQGIGQPSKHIHVAWLRKPRRQHLEHFEAEYLEWMGGVLQELANRVQKKILWIFPLGPTRETWQAWTYAPNSIPQRVPLDALA